MPTETFARLPEEKRNRFLDAAWAEFTRVPFADTSINQIVRQAGIPRGSFYQYFADKEELFVYLLNGVKHRLVQSYLELIRSQGGDLFRSQMAAFDRALDQCVGKDPFMDRCARILRINPGIDLQKMMKGRPGDQVLEKLCGELDLSAFRRREPEVVQQAFFLSLMALGSSVMDSLVRPEDRALHRRELETRLTIIQHGCMGAAAGRPSLS